MLRLEYDFHPVQNNGNVTAHRIINGSTTWTQSFEYDSLNRLSVAWENNVKRVYGYDRYGNRWVDQAQSTWTIQTTDVHEPGYETNFDAGTNRLVAPVTYDAAGNQTLYTRYTLWYDAENRNYSITSPNNSQNGSMIFAYDGDGRRVKKSWSPNGGPTITTHYVYDALGQLAAEYSNGIPANGLSYPFTDMLGSVRGVTNSSGADVDYAMRLKSTVILRKKFGTARPSAWELRARSLVAILTRITSRPATSKGKI